MPTYGNKFTVAEIVVAQIIYLEYTLRMLGVPVDRHAILFGDNKAVIDSTMVPSYYIIKVLVIKKLNSKSFEFNLLINEIT